MLLRNDLVVALGLPQILALEDLTSYSHNDVIYALKQLMDAGFIDAQSSTNNGRLSSFCVYDITPDGHKLLKDISSNTIWAKLMKKVLKVGEVSLPVLLEWAREMAAHL